LPSRFEVLATARRAAALAALVLCAAVSRGQAVSGRPMTAAGLLKMRDAGNAYAKGDVSATLNFLEDILRKSGRTMWKNEALYLRGLIREKEYRDRDGALQDFRLLTTRNPGTASAVFGQFHIARIYESAGLLDEAYREYVLCSRLRGMRGGEGEFGPFEFPAPRIKASLARGLTELAALRAVYLHATVSPDATRNTSLPARTILLTDPPTPVDLPTDMGARNAPTDSLSEWYLVSPHGVAISHLSIEFAACIDALSGGSHFTKRYSLVVEACAPADDYQKPPSLSLAGVSRTPKTLIRDIAFDASVQAVRLSFYRHGARVQKCVVRATLGEAQSVPRTVPELPGFQTVVPVLPEGAGSPSLASAGGTVFLVYHSPGPSADTGLEDDRDIYFTLSRDGTTWEPPRRLPISSAVDDSFPSLGYLRNGHLFLAWTSDRRGAGASDIYTSESKDMSTWSTPARLEFRAQDLESFARKTFITYHCPLVAVGTRGRARIFFTAKGFLFLPGDKKPLSTVEATGLFGIGSPDGRTWTKPEALLTTPQTHLDGIKPAPRLASGRELVSWFHRPSVIELTPVRLLAAWITTEGRVLFSVRDEHGTWSTENSQLAGADTKTAATSVELLGALDNGTTAMVMTRKDFGARLVWRDDAAVKSQPVAEQPLPIELVCPVSVRSATSPGWLTAWIASDAPAVSSVYVREILPPAVRVK
jgi:hypothetical protein